MRNFEMRILENEYEIEFFPTNSENKLVFNAGLLDVAEDFEKVIEFYGVDVATYQIALHGMIAVDDSVQGKHNPIHLSNKDKEKSKAALRWER